MKSNEVKSAGSISIGIPAVIVGVLIALKHVGLTNISYLSIAVFGFEVWVICALIAIAIWLLMTLIIFIFSSN